jgi:hypothetical protein
MNVSKLRSVNARLFSIVSRFSVVQRLGTQDTRGLGRKSAGPRIQQDLLEVVLQDFDHAPCLRAQVRAAISARTHRMEFVGSVHCYGCPSAVSI